MSFYDSDIGEDEEDTMPQTYKQLLQEGKEQVDRFVATADSTGDRPQDEDAWKVLVSNAVNEVTPDAGDVVTLAALIVDEPGIVSFQWVRADTPLVGAISNAVNEFLFTRLMEYVENKYVPKA